jgi:dihydroorotase
MKILLQQVFIQDENSKHNQSVKDILIENDTIISIENNIDANTADKVIHLPETVAAAGFVDCFADFCDPGFEFKETIESGAAAAASGGYTQVFVVPNTQPITQTKAQVEYISQKSQSLSVTVHPVGAVSKNIEGKDLAEMYDMFANGAIAFSDGLHPLQNSGLLLKALQYVKAFNGIIIQMPVDKNIGAYGLMNEGIVSTRMGLQAIPAVGEEIIIQRDIDLLRYTESKLHITGISTAKGLQLVQQAKAEGLNLTCSVTPYHLFFCEDDLQDYDTNLKVNPPLRSKEDMTALRKGVTDGTVDMIASHHFPQHSDKKVCEFENAENGMIGLQTAFAAVNNVLPNLSLQQITNLFGNNVRKIFNIPTPVIEAGNKAEITLFNRKIKTVLQHQNIKSKSFNSPFIDKELNGKIIGTIHKGNLSLNQ